MDWELIGLLGLNFILSTTGDTISKVWATHPGPKWALVTIGLSVLTAISWMLVVRRTGLSVGSAIMLLLTMLSTVTIGFLIFGEQITRGQTIGIALGFLAALFLLGIVRIP
jgi:drug/metabolite transporter (DMT)-like permease